MANLPDEPAFTVKVRVVQLAHANGLPLPTHETAGSAGVDLLAAIPESMPLVLRPLERGLIPTGLKIALPIGYELQIRPRSGLALRSGVTCLNAPGTVDADYRGELGVILINLGNEDFVVHRGDRVAQMILTQYSSITWTLCDGLDATPRGEKGFGSTGK